MIDLIFISRDLEPESDFKRILEGKGFKVEGVSLISIKPIPFSSFPQSDWIFFYSKNGVDCFFSQFGYGLEQFVVARLAAIGPGTAGRIQYWKLKVSFTGNGDAEETAIDFAKLAEGQSVLFPRAKNSRRSVQKFLPESVRKLDLIVYDNEPKILPQPTKAKILVFTSPMNAKSYFSNHGLGNDQSVLAIGQSTLNTLNELGVKHPVLADEPSEEALALAILTKMR